MTQHLKKRIHIVCIGLLFLYFIIIVYLFIIQIAHSAFYNTIARQQYNVVVTTPPPRAELYDKHGKSLAHNIARLSAFTIPSQIQEPKKLHAFLRKHFPQAATRLHNNPPAHFMYIKRRLSDQEIELITKKQLADIYFLTEPARFYPIESCGPVIGLTDSDTHGIAGLELVYNTELAGTPSTYFLQKDARSGHYYFNKETRIKGTEGTSLTLTLDATLQFLAHEELKETVIHLKASEGSVLILDPLTGDILAMTSYPDFDQNDQSKLHDLDTLKNRTVTESYELGSVMKVFFALAAIEENIVTPNEIIDCENKKETLLSGVRITTTVPHDKITFSEVIEYSNNIGTSKVADRLGNKLYDHYRRCGFGKKTGLNFPGEQQGFLNPPSRWTRQSVYSYSFGYEVTATLLQLARAFSLLATDGYLITPRLHGHDKAPVFSERLYSPKTIETIRTILQKTITQGTARKAHIDGYEIFGKTGTANLISDGKYDQGRNIFTFVGLIEKGHYKRIIVTFIKEGNTKNLYASSITAPLFERIAQKMLIHDKIL